MTVFGKMANSRVRACAPKGVVGEVVKLVDFLENSFLMINGR